MASTNQPTTIVAHRDPTDAEIAYFLSTRTGAEMVQLVHAIGDPTAQAALTTALLFAPPVVSGRTTTPEKAEKAKKAVNGFVAFRSYYKSIPSLKLWPMMKLSGPLGLMWGREANKPLWSLLGKAWSIIRDQIGEEKASRDQFFRIICPYLNIPSPETYLDRHGWKFDTDDEGAPRLTRESTPTPESLDVGIAATTLSVEDIIQYCQSMGYAQEFVLDTNLTSSTFLGHSLSTTTMQTTDSVHEARVAVRNKRRAKRQNKRDAGFAQTLRQEVAIMHDDASYPSGSTPSLQPTATEAAVAEAEMAGGDTLFYTGFSNLLSSHLQQGNAFQDNNNGFGSFFEEAFRSAADQDATLPSFASHF
ncbi:MAT1-1-1 mating-type protein [Lophiotrema nucula]|uniref:Mating-type protein MAT-1 n=1 Tax=Lophiotrema nucula TaxID=690887 RepID=A0A6A5YG91_9PLEO|nr:MAT1-1-1 mating-type protein [Lophiotrema nucula]